MSSEKITKSWCLLFKTKKTFLVWIPLSVLQLGSNKSVKTKVTASFNMMTFNCFENRPNMLQVIYNKWDGIWLAFVKICKTPTAST